MIASIIAHVKVQNNAQSNVTADFNKSILKDFVHSVCYLCTVYICVLAVSAYKPHLLLDI